MKRTFNFAILCISCLLAVGASVTISENAFGHGGGLDSKGCHTNRKTGQYHCHRSQSPLPSAPVQNSTSSNREPNLARDLVWKNCSEARAAGAAPVRRGDPGYGPHLDRDNDGVGCE